MKYFAVIFLYFFFSGLNEAKCQYRLEWKKLYTSFSSRESISNDLITDSSGNVYEVIASQFNSTSNNYECVTIKYSSTGDSLWGRRFTMQSENVAGHCITLDRQNNVYVGANYYVLKYDQNGNLLWNYHNFVSGFYKIFLDTQKNIYLSGQGSNTVTAKLDSNGNQLWVKQYAYGDFSSAALDKHNNVYTAGTAYSHDHDYFLVRYNPLGDSTWVRTFNGSSSTVPTDILYGVAVDSSCNAYITGTSEGSVGIRNLNVLKYDSLGNLIWERRYGGDVLGGAGYDIKVDKEQNIIVTGESGNNYTTLKYSNSGNLIWEYFYSGYLGSSIDPKKMFVDNSTSEIYTLARGSVNSGFKVFCLSKDGILNWSSSDSGIVAYPTCIAVDRFKNVFVGGYKYTSVETALVEKYSQFITTIYQNGTDIQKSFILSQNYPNPFNPTTKINYELSNSGFVSLLIFDIQGKEIETFINKRENAGSHSVEFNAMKLPSGIYFYTLKTEKYTETKKMVLIK